MLLCCAGILGGVVAGVISDRVFDSRRGPVASILYGGMLAGALVMIGVLGTPLLQDPFHANRWDYWFYNEKRGRELEPVDDVTLQHDRRGLQTHRQWTRPSTPRCVDRVISAASRVVDDTRVRAGISLDAREQTEYGTLRAYLLGGWQYTSNDAPTLSLPGTAVPTAGGAATAGATPNGNNNLYLARAFIQFAGFTLGKSASAFYFFDTARYSLQTNFAYQDLGRFGINAFTYTAPLGGGWTASLGIEDGTFYARPIKDLNAAPPAGVIAGFGTFFPILASGGPTNSPWNNAGFVVPDIASNIRVDQSWGAAQVMGALHDDRARYYNATANGLLAGVAHPADACQ